MNNDFREKLTRLLGFGFFSSYVIYRTIVYLKSPGTGPLEHLLFVTVILTFVIIASTYLIRSGASSRAEGFMERFFPFLPSVLPVAVATTWWMVRRPWSPYLFYFPTAGWWNNFWLPMPVGRTQTIFFVLVALAGNILVVVSLFSLRRSFSIMSEARTPVIRGPYRFVRHPVYLGEMIATLALVGLLPCWGSFLLCIVFIVTQFVRARVEERKLAAVFPEYLNYLHRTGMFLPRFFIKD